MNNFVIFKSKKVNMITWILGIVLFIVWILGGIFASLVTGWEVEKTRDLLKIIFWPIAIFICKD